MVGVISSGEIGGMTPIASRGRSFELIVDVARRAGLRRVRASQCKPSVLQMVEFGANPAIRGMAGLAVGREMQAYVIERRGQVILLVAGIACRGETLELPRGCARVALLAVYQRMCSDQRKPVLVIADGVHRNLPALDAVTLLAGGTHFAAMQVGMTFGALRADLGKDEAGMAGRAAQLLVHAAQRIAGVIVIEFGNRADRLPTGACMAALAGCRDGAMRICYFGARSACG